MSDKFAVYVKLTAPEGKTQPHYTVIGASDPRATRIIGEIQRAGARRNIG